MNTDIPKRLADAMRQAGLVNPRNDTASRNAWSTASGVHTSTISRWLNGGNMRGDNAQALADALGVTVQEMFRLAGLNETSAPWTPPKGTESLTQRQKAALSELVLAFIDDDRGARNDNQTPGTPPPLSPAQEPHAQVPADEDEKITHLHPEDTATDEDLLNMAAHEGGPREGERMRREQDEDAEKGDW